MLEIASTIKSTQGVFCFDCLFIFSEIQTQNFRGNALLVQERWQRYKETLKKHRIFFVLLKKAFFRLWPGQKRKKKTYFCVMFAPLTTWGSEAIKILFTQITPSGSHQCQPGQQRQKSISSGKPILRFLRINNQNYNTNRRGRHIFRYNYTQVMAFILFFLQIIRRSGSSARGW